MTYILKMVGPDEKLIGVARLHWVYLVKGMIGFASCVLIAVAINKGINFALSLLYKTAGSIPPSFQRLVDNSYLMSFMVLCGGFIFLCYLIKVLGTEIGLTSRRIIHKEGLIFVHTHEVDIEEIRGETMDLGYFGRWLDYGYLKLDCRFVDDVTTPAIENPERFLKALHKIRSETTDSVVTIAAHPDENTPKASRHAASQSINSTAEPPEPVAPPTPSEVPVQPPTPMPPLEPIAPPVSPEVPVQPNQPAIPTPQQPPLKAASAEIDAKMVAEIVKQTVPKIVEEMAAQGLVVPDPALPHPNEDLLTEFDEASGEQKPRAIH